MKGFEQWLVRLLRLKGGSVMDIDSDSLLQTLAESNYGEPDLKSGLSLEEEPHRQRRWWEFPYLKGLRFTAIFALVAIMVTGVIYYSFRFIKEVILYDNELYINERGTFNPHKALNCEYALFLFNTADIWANSGIQVNENDKIKINISGAYNSCVNYVKRASEENVELTYPWVRYDRIEEPDVSQDRALLHAIHKEYPIGSALFAIFPESEELDTDPFIWSDPRRAEAVSRWTPESNRSFKKAEKSGTLHFTVNDMFYRNESEVKAFYNSDNTGYRRNTLSEEEKTERIKNHRLDFDDNLGQLLVAVEIRRHVPNQFFHPMIAYRELEYNVRDIHRDDNPFKAWRVFKEFVVFIAWISALFAIWTIAVVGGLYLLFLLSHLLRVGVDAMGGLWYSLLDGIWVGVKRHLPLRHSSSQSQSSTDSE